MSVRCIRKSRYNDAVTRLQYYVLVGVFSLDYIFVVEGKPLLGTIRPSAQYIDALLFGKVFEAAANRYRI